MKRTKRRWREGEEGVEGLKDEQPTSLIVVILIRFLPFDYSTPWSFPLYSFPLLSFSLRPDHSLSRVLSLASSPPLASSPSSFPSWQV